MIHSCMVCGHEVDSPHDTVLPDGFARVVYVNRRNRTCTAIGCSPEHALKAAKAHAKKIVAGP